MSLARAFTTIGKRAKVLDEDFSMPSFMSRSSSQRASRPIVRADISSPLALVSTSNMQVHNAKRIAGTSAIDIQHVTSTSSSVASLSGDDSDSSVHPYDNDVHTDASSVDESPIRSEPEPNHLSCYFKPTVDTTSIAGKRTRASTTGSPSISRTGSVDANIPRIPQRVPSHSKKAHERIHRTRSMQRITNLASASIRGLPRSNSDNILLPQLDFVEAPGRNDAPFGLELAQLDEIAEEFGQVFSTQRYIDTDDDVTVMSQGGLAHFNADDYMAEIQALVVETFGVAPTSARETVAWF